MRLRHFLKSAALPAAGLALAAQLSAQELKPFRDEDGTPVKRADPVRPPKAQPLAEGNGGGEPADAAPAAPLAATPLPRVATPIPKDPAVKKSNKKATPIPTPPKEAALPPTPEPSDPGDIRIAPQSGIRTGEQMQLDVADSYYSRKMFELAAAEYQRYLELYPSGPDLQTVYFRLAESYRQTGTTNAAKMNYDLLLSRFQNGDFIGPAAYRLAEMYYEDKNYQLALPLFRRAAVRLREPAVICAARFFTGRCLEQNGSKSEARAEYEMLAEMKDANPFQEASRLSLALLLRDSNQVGEAIKQVQLLAKQTENPNTRAEALVRSGIWQIDLAQNDRSTAEQKKTLSQRAAAELQKALAEPGIGKWKEVAQMGLIRTYYDAGNYQQVVDTYTQDGQTFSAATKPELLLVTADSLRQLGKVADALPIYEQVIKEFPNSVYAKEAAYQRLVALYNADDAKLLGEIDKYLGANTAPDRRDQVILMKAEMLFKQQNYKDAAALYELLSNSRQLTGTLRGEAVFRLGWCSMQVRNYEKAIAAFTTLADEFPTNKSLPYALAQRALAYQSLKNMTAAEKDFDVIIRKYPGAAKERELALNQKALMRGQQNDNTGMTETFEKLLKDYPNSAAAPAAHYWIGMAAFDAKDYKKAIDHLKQARQADSEQYFEKATLRLILAAYYLEDAEAVAKEVDLYEKQGKTKTPVEVLRWLSEVLLKAKSYVEAEKYLTLLSQRDEVQPRDRLNLGKARLDLAKYKEAAEAFEGYLQTVQEPPSKALGLLDLARAQIGMRDPNAAQKSVDQALSLQPEGKISGEARILAGDVQASRNSWDEAAKLYSSVAVILDDEEITPRALEKAVGAYNKAGKEPEAKKTLNTLQSRYPEYIQRQKEAKP